MTASEILSLTAVQLGEKNKRRRGYLMEAVKAVLGQIKAMEPEINSYVTIDEEGAFKQAEEIQKRMNPESLLALLLVFLQQ